MADDQMTAATFWYWVGGRRFVLTVGSGLVNTILLWFGKLDTMVFRDLILGTVGVYLTSATIQKWRERKEPTDAA
jgi:hypothetical protein